MTSTPNTLLIQAEEVAAADNRTHDRFRNSRRGGIPLVKGKNRWLSKARTMILFEKDLHALSRISNAIAEFFQRFQFIQRGNVKFLLNLLCIRLLKSGF